MMSANGQRRHSPPQKLCPTVEHSGKTWKDGEGKINSGRVEGVVLKSVPSYLRFQTDSVPTFQTVRFIPLFLGKSASAELF